MTTSGRPQRGEYADYSQKDFEYVVGDDAIAALREVARETLALFESLTEDDVRARTYAPGKWTLKQVAGHLVDDERIFACRALCVARGEKQALPGFDENDYVAATDFESRPLADLLRDYRVQREATIALFGPLTEEEWLRARDSERIRSVGARSGVPDRRARAASSAHRARALPHSDSTRVISSTASALSTTVSCRPKLRRTTSRSELVMKMTCCSSSPTSSRRYASTP